MAWDNTELMMGTFDANARHEVKKVAGGGSICFQRFDSDGKLYFVRDKVVDDETSATN